MWTFELLAEWMVKVHNDFGKKSNLTGFLPSRISNSPLRRIYFVTHQSLLSRLLLIQRVLSPISDNDNDVQRRYDGPLPVVMPLMLLKHSHSPSNCFGEYQK